MYGCIDYKTPFLNKEYGIFTIFLIIAKSSSVIILFLIFSITCLSNAETVDLAKYDGNDWQTWDSLRKHHFITGFISGSGYAIENNFAGYNISPAKDYDLEKAFSLRYPKPDISKGKKKTVYDRNEVNMMLEYDKRSRNSTLLSYEIAKITNGQIVEGLNQLYSDFKNRQIILREAIYVVKKQISGASEEEIQSIFEYLRATESDRSFDKLLYKDKMGNTKWAIFP